MNFRRVRSRNRTRSKVLSETLASINEEVLIALNPTGPVYNCKVILWRCHLLAANLRSRSLHAGIFEMKSIEKEVTVDSLGSPCVNFLEIDKSMR